MQHSHAEYSPTQRTNERLVLKAARLDGVEAAAPLERADHRPLSVRGDAQGADLRKWMAIEC